ncbi:hypothetical protein FC83_GL000074 [Agrilactobacillus composti DSM 18527 = JCM 14202]|uniref:Regulatory protein YycH domain-containing protein n=1 Tax=Agrilactobacillus composti DSM 18527 = JCM 14202 TaxID=1423734 RepID=X0QSF1_9LACO|nr:two-component system activity regulator YycH [Agrilactobacillus composti]KRM32985.1 hypothetical protein FC83_GL000074 [Agrilactobacillus composti DSM 18527 = JCM 14202]GAF41510.1 YycH protein [Agrilactobacillus composti DSM 18527 = JCM 14202]
MGIKLSDIFLKAGLIIAVTISVILSFLIWTNNARYERNPDTKVSTAQEQSKTDKELADVYLPTRILQKNQQQQYMVYNRRDSPIMAFQKRFKTWQLTGSITAKNYNNGDYLNQINAPEQVQLTYPGVITWRLFKQMYKLTEKKATADFSFNRIILKNNDNKTVYLTNDNNQVVHKVPVANNRGKQLRALLKNADMRLPVEERVMNNKLTLYYTKPVKITPYSYLISRENINTYISTLLADKGDSSIEARESGSVTTYYRGIFKKLSADSSNDQIQYEDYTDTVTVSSTTQLLRNSFSRLVNVGNSLANVRYFSSVPKTQVVTYLNYVEGFPIYQQSDFGAASIQLTPSGQVLRFSSRTLQVPVPAENQDNTLPATQDVLNQLAANNVDLATIKDIQLGYHWTQSSANQQVIDLKPTYYVFINNTWKDYRDLLAQ